MYQAYRRIFWGIFFLTFTITIGSLKILPSFVAYIIIHSGINLLYNQYNSNLLEKSRKAAVIAIVVSLINIDFDLFIDLDIHSLLSIIWLAVILLIELILFYYLLEASTDLLQASGHTELAGEYSIKTKNYITIYSILAIALIICYAFLISTMMLLISIALIIVRIWLMVIINSLKKIEPYV